MKNETDKLSIKKPVSLEDMEIFIELFKKKFNSFKKRAPIFFTFQVSALKIYIQIEDQLEILEFDIDYSSSVEREISKIKQYLRVYEYPNFSCSKIIKIEPDIHKINNMTKEKGISFNRAFNILSKKEVKIDYTIDKIDIAKNKMIVIEKSDLEDIGFYQMDLPVLIFLRRLKALSEIEKYDEFIKHSKKIED
jgi:hypothetical protein